MIQKNLDLKMRWQASSMRHLFHLLPGQKILVIGANKERFARALEQVTRGECQITTQDAGSSGGEKFDYVVADHVLDGQSAGEFLKVTKSLIRPGGGLLLYESMSQRKVLPQLTRSGYVEVNALPYDFLYPAMPGFLLGLIQSLNVVLENFPGLRNLANTAYIWGFNPAPESQARYVVDLARHEEFFNNVSFVVPCHNEEKNIAPLIEGLKGFFGKYILEIIMVDDNSSDQTAEIITKCAVGDRRVRLLRRSPPNGVGRALREGLSQAKGEYVLIMDGDFQHIIPEMRDLFDAVAQGADVAVGSRFSRDSVLVNYAFVKILANRAFHLFANLLLGQRCRDISNNLKLFRASVAKKLVIESNDFAANAETGLKPMLLGYRVVEIPISWVNRSDNMGSSTFQIFNTGPNYFKLLSKLIWRRLRSKK